jgi:CIC family chloride channel protein
MEKEMTEAVPVGVTNAPPKLHSFGPIGLLSMAFLVGIIAALGAVAFRGLIAFVHNLLFLGQISFVYDANVHTPNSPWGPLFVFVPALGALGVSFLVTTFAPEAKGHGVPEVMDAIYYNAGRIRPIVALMKSLASALSIGSGGSVGREGPIIQIGSSFGSTWAQLLRMPTWQRITLIGAGAGAGIAATFNTPVGGILFAVEIMLQELSVRTLVPVAIATATATYLGQVFFGPHPSFVILSFENFAFHVADPKILVCFAVLGVLSGLVSTVYIQSIYVLEDFLERHGPRNYYLRHTSCMLLVGILLYGCQRLLGHYYVEGIGYAAIQDVLTARLASLWLLLLLALLKLIMTSLTLGSGASGGVFSPALYIGAMLGGAYGLLLRHLFPLSAGSVPAFAVAGMAGVVGGSTGAALAAIVMIFEMTLDYNVIIPMTVTVALGYGVRKQLLSDSIYTLKLSRRGHVVPAALRANFQERRPVAEVMDTRFSSIPAQTSLADFARTTVANMAEDWYLVKQGDELVGIVSKDMALRALSKPTPKATVGELASKNYVTAMESAPLGEVAALLHPSAAPVALVVRAGREGNAGDVLGMLTRGRLADALFETTELFG